MHAPENLSGCEYVELVAAVSILLAKNQTASNTFLLSEFLFDVSHFLLELAAFTEAQENRNKNAAAQANLDTNIEMSMAPPTTAPETTPTSTPTSRSRLSRRNRL